MSGRCVGGGKRDTARAAARDVGVLFGISSMPNPPVGRLRARRVAEKTGPARRVRPEVFGMRHTRLAGGRISEWGSVTGTLATRVKPKPRGTETEPRAYLSPRPVRLTGPVRRGGDEGKIRVVEGAWIDLRWGGGEGWVAWGSRPFPGTIRGVIPAQAGISVGRTGTAN